VDVMNEFEVIQTLGVGISSTVLEVQCVKTGQRCALKRLPRTEKYSESLFVSECKFLHEMQYPGVIKIIDTFVDEANFYILTELGVDDLFKRVNTKKCPEKEAKEVIRFLLETLKQLHRDNIVHRDIKPENIVFTEKNSNFPKLIDFGDAEIIKDNQKYTEFLGTKCYLAPERWRAHHGWELKASDIWAIGVLAFEMTTGKRCFYASPHQSLVEKIQDGCFRYPRVKLSKLCRHFIESLLTVQSGSRPSAEYALQHPWLSTCEDHQVLCSLAQQWNTTATDIPPWSVYLPSQRHEKA